MLPAEKLKFYRLAKSSPESAMVLFMEKMEAENKVRLEKEIKAVKEELLYEMERRIKELNPEILKRIDMIKGEKGDTPKLGVDYFTDEDIEAFVEDIRARLKL